MKNMNFTYGSIKEKDKINKNPKYNKIVNNNKSNTIYKPKNIQKVKTKGYPRGK